MEEYIEHKVKSKAEKYLKKAAKIILIIIAGIAFLLLFAYIFMYLWNWLMPEIFGLTTLTYLQAGGLLILCKIIFGCFGEGGGGKKKRKKRQSKKPFNSRRRGICNDDFSKWKHYDAFWKDEGEKAYEKYVEEKRNEKGDSPS
ncbi:hypothetical protein [Zobellia alginiliquefaciens]|uniref:hypothetical protein n=1 Tax=Zobellia alginiliquefaciens TaxID=3032586 RepID=UPI0023E3E478|nr:hypothetical protein [Zobellia alginiliquefaciens]